MKKVLFLFSSLVLLASCEENEESKVTIDKKGTIEVNLRQMNGENGVTTVLTEMNVYSNSGSLVNKIQRIDTVPMLEMVKDTLESNRENSDGDKMDTVISHHKNYQFYITLKPTIDLEKK